MDSKSSTDDSGKLLDRGASHAHNIQQPLKYLVVRSTKSSSSYVSQYDSLDEAIEAASSVARNHPEMAVGNVYTLMGSLIAKKPEICAVTMWLNDCKISE